MLVGSPLNLYRVGWYIIRNDILFRLFTDNSAIQLPRQILITDKYYQVLIDNTLDSIKPILDYLRAIISDQSFEVASITIGEHMDAYALVYRDSDPNWIYLNPLLLQ